MIPYHRFLLAVMSIPVSRETRLDILETAHCYGIQSQTANAFAIDLANNIQSKFPNLSAYLRTSATGTEIAFPQNEAEAFALTYKITDVFQYFCFSSAEKQQTPIRTVIELSTKRQSINVLLPLLLTEYPSDKIISVYKKRFGKEITQAELELFYFYFANFSSLTEQQILRWAETTPDRLRYLIRIALNEPIHFLLDELGLEGDIDANYAAGRVLTRSLVHFERLSSSRHHKALQEARKWADLALKAGDRKQRYDSGGNMHDFLAEFRINLMEMPENNIPQGEYDEDD